MILLRYMLVDFVIALFTWPRNIWLTTCAVTRAIPRLLPSPWLDRYPADKREKRVEYLYRRTPQDQLVRWARWQTVATSGIVGMLLLTSAPMVVASSMMGLGAQIVTAVFLFFVVHASLQTALWAWDDLVDMNEALRRGLISDEEQPS